MPQWTSLSLATRETTMKKQKTQREQRKANVRQLVLETRIENTRSLEQQGTAMAEEGYCRQLTHSQTHQAHNAAEHVKVKHEQASTKEEKGKWYSAICTANR